MGTMLTGPTLMGQPYQQVEGWNHLLIATVHIHLGLNSNILQIRPLHSIFLSHFLNLFFQNKYSKKIQDIGATNSKRPSPVSDRWARSRFITKSDESLRQNIANCTGRPSPTYNILL